MPVSMADYLNDKQVAYLATVEKSYPRVRPITVMYYHARLWFATGSKDKKVSQLEINPNVEAIIILKGENCTGYLRISGTATKMNDVKLKKELADFSGYIYDYWQDASNPDYILYEIKPESVMLLKPGAMFEIKMEGIS